MSAFPVSEPEFRNRSELTLSGLLVDDPIHAAPSMTVRKGEGFLMRVEVERFSLARQPPALENLPRTKPRGSWRNLWGKCADGCGDGWIGGSSEGVCGS
jgi:hypothetical protein